MERERKKESEPLQPQHQLSATLNIPRWTSSPSYDINNFEDLGDFDIWWKLTIVLLSPCLQTRLSPDIPNEVYKVTDTNI